MVLTLGIALTSIWLQSVGTHPDMLMLRRGEDNDNSYLFALSAGKLSDTLRFAGRQMAIAGVRAPPVPA